MATRCEAEYAYTSEDSTVDLRCVHDAGHEFDHLFMVRWESAEWVTAPDGEEFRVGQCQGHAACPVERHEHGCYADDGANCDHPDEHPKSAD